MGRMADLERHVTGGVDTHSEVHVAAVVDSVTGRKLGNRSFATTRAGFQELLTWLGEHGAVDAVGVEGTGSYGAGLARWLTAAGVLVVEVDRPDRKMRRAHGKSDPVDAEAAALAVVSGRASGTPKSRDGRVEVLRVLKTAYDLADKQRTQLVNQFRAFVLTAPDELRSRLTDEPLRVQLHRVRRLHTGGAGMVTQATRDVLRRLSRKIEALEQEKKELDASMRGLMAEQCPALLGLFGVGPQDATPLLLAAGDNPERLRSEASFASLCGVSPVQASSGKIVRHRLNRGGDRQANGALWRIVMVRMAHHEPTKAYVRRRTVEGKTKREIIRCLKRFVCREAYRAITQPAEAQVSGAEVRCRRKEVGLSMTDLAAAISVSAQRLARVERCLTFDSDLARRALLHLAQGPLAAAA